MTAARRPRDDVAVKSFFRVVTTTEARQHIAAVRPVGTHPQSALVIFDLFGAPLLRVLGGEGPRDVFVPPRTTRARLSQNVASQPGREDYVRVLLEEGGGQHVATPLAGTSGPIFNLVQADGLVCIPASAEGLEAGTEIEVILL